MPEQDKKPIVSKRELDEIWEDKDIEVKEEITEEQEEAMQEGLAEMEKRKEALKAGLLTPPSQEVLEEEVGEKAETEEVEDISRDHVQETNISPQSKMFRPAINQDRKNPNPAGTRIPVFTPNKDKPVNQIGGADANILRQRRVQK